MGQVLEEGSALTEHDRADHDAELVEEAGLRQVGGEMGTAEQKQFLAAASLDGQYVRGRFAPDEGGP